MNSHTLRTLVRPVAEAVSRRSYHFGSSQFYTAFGNLPVADGPKLRKGAVDYLATFNAQAWYGGCSKIHVR